MTLSGPGREAGDVRPDGDHYQIANIMAFFPV